MYIATDFTIAVNYRKELKYFIKIAIFRDVEHVN